MHIPRRRFGQHFLVDRHYIDQIVRAIAPHQDQSIVEIGPGQGALTDVLSPRLTTLHVVEIDRDLAAALRSKYSDGQVVVHEHDALEFDFRALGRHLRIVGNLPYNISTPLLFRIAEQSDVVDDCHFMLQKEVVERMVASPGGGDYGRLSVMLQYRFVMEKLFDVPPEAFYPPPKVQSAVVRMRPIAAPQPRALSETTLSNVVTHAFTMRRKTLRNALKKFLNEEEMLSVDVNDQSRPETLSVAQYVALANLVAMRDDVS